MDQNAVTLLIIGGTLLVYTGIIVVAKKLKGKKLDAKAEKVVETVDKGLDYAHTLSAAVTPFLPGIAGTTLTKALSAAQKAVKCVEAPFKAELTTNPDAVDNRKAEATSLAKSGLALDGIQATPEIDKLIEAVIPVFVLALPKTHDVKVTVPAVPAPQTATQVESGAGASDATSAV